MHGGIELPIGGRCDLSDLIAGQRQRLAADTVILATGMKARKSEAMAFYGICPETAMVGDCNRVAKILEATNEGYFLGATV